MSHPGEDPFRLGIYPGISVDVLGTRTDNSKRLKDIIVGGIYPKTERGNNSSRGSWVKGNFSYFRVKIYFQRGSVKAGRTCFYWTYNSKKMLLGGTTFRDSSLCNVRPKQHSKEAININWFTSTSSLTSPGHESILTVYIPTWSGQNWASFKRPDNGYQASHRTWNRART